MKTKTEKIPKVSYEINSDDWTSGLEDRARCVSELEQWFDGLSLKSQMSIYYAQRSANDMAEKGEAFDPWNDGCPVLQQVFNAETRILKKHASWLFGEGGQCGFNFSLHTYKINL